jgi:hypothetical protein
MNHLKTSLLSVAVRDGFVPGGEFLSTHFFLHDRRSDGYRDINLLLPTIAQKRSALRQKECRIEPREATSRRTPRPTCAKECCAVMTRLPTTGDRKGPCATRGSAHVDRSKDRASQMRRAHAKRTRTRAVALVLQGVWAPQTEHQRRNFPRAHNGTRRAQTRAPPRATNPE